MPEYKLVYFNYKGRAEMTRMIFAAAGVKYEDCRLTRQKYQELKASRLNSEQCFIKGWFIHYQSFCDQSRNFA